METPGGHCLAHSEGSIGLNHCEGSNSSQEWVYDGASGQIHNDDGGCLTSTAAKEDDCGDSMGKCGVTLQACDAMNGGQQWLLDEVGGSIRNGQNCLLSWMRWAEAS